MIQICKGITVSQDTDMKMAFKIETNKQTNNNDLLEKDGGTKYCMYKD